MKKYDYTGKTIFIGIDVHKKSYSVAAIADGEVVKRDRLMAKPEILLNYLRKYFPGANIYSAYEAGFSGFGLHRFLTDNEIKNIVVHAASIEINSRDKVKTDKRDALKIATQLSDRRLKCVYIPSPEREDYRELTRLRDKLVKDRTKIANAIKAKGHYYGLIDPEDSRKVSAKWIEWFLKKNSLAKNAEYYLEHLADEWERYTNKIKEVNAMISEQALEDSELEEVYRSSPGIGPIAARLLANELGDTLHFSSMEAISCYTGLTPCEYSSGEHRWQGNISRQGKPQLRRILVQCAWVAIREDQELAEIYSRIARRAGSKRAIVAIARRLIVRIRSCFKNKCLYRSYKKPPKKAVAA